jgi:hypothetical protein
VKRRTSPPTTSRPPAPARAPAAHKTSAQPLRSLRLAARWELALWDEHWLEEPRTGYDERRWGSCGAACSVPSDCSEGKTARPGSWSEARRDKTSAQPLRSLRLTARWGVGTLGRTEYDERRWGSCDAALLGTLALLGGKYCSAGSWSEARRDQTSAQPLRSLRLAARWELALWGPTLAR